MTQPPHDSGQPGDQPEQPRPPSYSRDPNYPQYGEQQQNPYGGQQPYPGGSPYGEQQPPYGNPYYGQQPPGGDGRTEPLAIWSLVAGIVGLFTCGILSLVAVVLGHLSIRRIQATGRRGRGMALAGLVLGYLALVGWIIYWILVLVAGTHGGHSGRY
ncbi:DUF4190 domain-containing protein [Actinomadura rayongensis]|uniref:DUF4190 domain-containing protein n=1 Tax=Actinomadura rayongensis TaxID=1429076 RepID=A0A6I4W5V2_9ACTN|nr:DUF4190 domain-containing protein [Actinomadura rayongensis]MXQ66099.1 DUF4190 domain-containing protein [Actinomadura rayongensis]